MLNVFKVVKFAALACVAAAAIASPGCAGSSGDGVPHPTQGDRPRLRDERNNGPEPSLEEIDRNFNLRLDALRKMNADDPLELDAYGGWKNAPGHLKTSNPSGYFRVEKLGGAWWFITPDGNPFVSKGVTDVNWLGATLAHDAFHDIIAAKYGTEEAWVEAAAKRMLDWGFNTIGPWSSASVMERMPHAGIILDMGGGNGPRHPGAVVTDYYDPAFVLHAGAMAEQRAKPHAEDKNLIGFFLDNEVVWGADHFRTNKSLLQLYAEFPAGAPGRAEALRFLREQSGTLEAFNAAWKTNLAGWAELESLPGDTFAPGTDAALAAAEAFMLQVFHRYIEVSLGALRAAAPNHLVLGCRFHNYPGDALYEAAAAHFDVISMAFYEPRPPVEEIDAIHGRVDRPVLIEEWTFKSHDSGIRNSHFGIYAPEVRTMRERGLAYDGYVETFMRRPYGIGYHWYKWMDNPILPDKRFSGDNCGLLNHNDEPYEPFVTFASEVNRRVERWHASGAVPEGGPGAKADEAGGNALSTEEILGAISTQEARLPGLKDALAGAEARGLDVSYPRNDLTVAEMFVPFGREDAAQGRIGRAAEVAEEIAGLLDRAQAEMTANRAVPRLADGPVAIRDGSLWAETVSVEGRREQPVFLTGYGHFARVIQDIPLLAQMGVNFVQFELGPAAALTAEGGETGQIEEYVIHALDRAQEHGVRVDLLLSPHQNMPWWHEHWPETWLDAWPYISHVPFIKWSVDAPQVRAVLERYLRTIIPRIKDHPALHSVCLTNEPDYRLAPQDPWRRPKWTDYLREVHGDIETLNRNHGAGHAAFEEVGLPTFGPAWYDEHPLKAPEVDNLAWLYDGVRFNQREFAAWHAWMRDIIHEMAPALPVHAKVMPVVWGRYAVYWGTDPYDFAQLSQLNGNDCYFEPTPRHAPWKSTWQVQNMYYDLQRSMKRVPVINTENHIIPDRFDRHVSPEHIHTALWQGAVHGQGASATWTWERTYDRKSDAEGLILHRAACVAEMGRVALDLMRLGPEMAALQNIQPRVAILWSNASWVHEKRYFPMMYRVYEALNFCGVPVGFLSEEQLIAEGAGGHTCVIAPGVTNAHRGALEVLRAFQRGGGRVIAYGDENLTRDQYGLPVQPVAPDAVISQSMSGETLRDRLLDELAQAGISPHHLIRNPDGAVNYGVEWRDAAHEGAMLLNLVNLTRHDVEVLLPEGRWHDLISGKDAQGTLFLPTNRPHLLRKMDEGGGVPGEGNAETDAVGVTPQASSAAMEAQPVTLVADGKARAVVVTAAAPSKMADYAARELVEHIEKATGTRLDIVAEGSGESTAPCRVYVGATAAAKALGYAPESLPNDAFVLRTKGPDLYVFGREEQDAEPLRNDVPSGTLFGVYELLERYAGVRWMWPGQLGTVVPAMDSLAIAESLNEEQAPRLRFRNIYWHHVKGAAADYKPEVERLAFSRAGLQAYRDDLEVFLKRNRIGFSEPKPKVSHNFCGWWPKYGKDHPEWFMLNDEGTRGPGSKARLERWRLQHVGMCVSNPELQRFLVEEAWDGGDTIDLSETDYRAFCRCDKCRAWDAPAPEGYYPDLHRMGWDGALEGPSEYDDFIPMNVSDRYARFWKTVREMAIERNPKVTVSSFLYWNYFPAPLREINLEGVYGEFVPWTRANKWMPMPDAAYEWNRQQWLGWQKTGIQLAYRPNYFHGGYVMPQISTWQAGDFIRFAYAHGMMGANFDSLLGHWAAKAPMFYIHFRLFWNPELETSQLRGEYFSAFGPAASLVEQYTDYWEQHAAGACVPLDPWPESGLWSPTRAHIHYPEESFGAAAALLEQARALAEQRGRPEHVQRVAFLQHGLEHARLAARLMAALAHGRAPVFDPPRFAKAQQALQALVNYRRAHEGEYIADYLYAAIRENEYCEMDVLFRDAKDVLAPNLNGQWGAWRFRKDPENRGIEETWFTANIRDEDWAPIEVPGCWEDQHKGHGWYYNTVQIPEDWKGRAVTLLFEGVSEEAWVYVNGKLVGEHTVNGAKLPPAIIRTWPFEISVPKDVVIPGAVNTVMVRVHAALHPGGLSGPVYGFSKNSADRQDTKKPWG